MSDGTYDLSRAQAYWRHAPSGEGKHDTSALVDAPDDRLLMVWDDAFRSRFRGYPEEDLFLRTLAPTVAGQRMLSVGSGLGFHEIYYAARGARVTCADIVPTNLRVIERVAGLKGVGMETRDALGPGGIASGEAYEVVFIYGSLMAMPAERQRELLARAAAALAPGGRLILMLYTWEFVRRTCGWTSPAEFDPLVFARASDPTVGDEACPWSDWHDEDKLLDLAGPAFTITRMQTWNDGVYVWFELQRGDRRSSQPPRPFFHASELEPGDLIARVHGGDWVMADATGLGSGTAVRVRTGVNRFNYALMSRPLTRAEVSRANAIVAELEIEDGAASVGLLDLDRNAFAATAIITARGLSRTTFLTGGFPDRSQIVISNHRPDVPGASTFTVRWVDCRRSEMAEPPTPAGSPASRA